MSKYPMDHRIKRPFAWTKPEATDVAKTFARERARLKAIAEAEASKPHTVTAFRKGAK